MTLAHELTLREDEAAIQLLAAVRSLADVITDLFLTWLPNAKYLSPQGDARLLNAITQAAT